MHETPLQTADAAACWRWPSPPPRRRRVRRRRRSSASTTEAPTTTAATTTATAATATTTEATTTVDGHDHDHRRSPRRAADRAAHGRRRRRPPARRWWSRSTTSPGPGPRSGINQADIVFEELVEGITRFAAVFQLDRPRPRWADPLGPHQRHRPAGRAGQAAARLVGRQPDGHEAGRPPPPARGCSSTPAGAPTRRSTGREQHPPGPAQPVHQHPDAAVAVRRRRHLAAQAIFPTGPAGTPVPASATPAPGVTINFGQRRGRVLRLGRGGQGLGPLPGRPAARPGPQRHARRVRPAGRRHPTWWCCSRPTACRRPTPSRPRPRSVGDGTGLVLVGRPPDRRSTGRARPTPARTRFTDRRRGARTRCTPGRTWVALPAVGSP